MGRILTVEVRTSTDSSVHNQSGGSGTQKLEEDVDERLKIDYDEIRC